MLSNVCQIFTIQANAVVDLIRTEIMNCSLSCSSRHLKRYARIRTLESLYHGNYSPIFADAKVEMNAVN